MDVLCGMCGDPITVPEGKEDGALCKACQSHTIEYIHPNEETSDAHS